MVLGIDLPAVARAKRPLRESLAQRTERPAPGGDPQPGQAHVVLVGVQVEAWLGEPAPDRAKPGPGDQVEGRLTAEYLRPLGVATLRELVEAPARGGGLDAEQCGGVVDEREAMLGEEPEQLEVGFGQGYRAWWTRSARRSVILHGPKSLERDVFSPLRGEFGSWVGALGASEPGMRQRARVHDLEVSAGQPVEQVQRVVVPARVRGPRDEPRRAVVGQDHPVALERLGHDASLVGETRDVDVRLEADAEPHRREVRPATRRGLVAG